MDRCWTAARLARHGLPHDDLYALCAQELETIDHLLLHRSFSRIIWHEIFAWCRAPTHVPQDLEVSFLDWWSSSVTAAPTAMRKGLSSLVLLAAWSLWRHRNACIFDNARPSTTLLLQAIKDDARIWASAGAKDIANLMPP